MNLIELSQQLLSASKSSSSITSLLNKIETIDLSQLQFELNTDEKRKAFWINIYNSFATIYLKPNPKIILNPFSRKRFFNTHFIQINNYTFCLNDIEHHILRRSKIWWSKGYISNPFVSPHLKSLRISKLDARIHFALNCGGLGCPPIRHYNNKSIDEQLDTATQAFLYSETSLNSNKKQVRISKLFSWYIGDFGGNQGIISFLKNYNIINEKENPKIVYSAYNWEPWIK